MKEIVQECTKKCPWCPLGLLVGGAVLFVLGLILDAAMIKAMWFLLGIVALGAGGVGFYFSPKIPKMKAKEKPTEQAPTEEKPAEQTPAEED